MSAAPNAEFLHARILLAEDNEINREIALALLSSIGIEADAVENGRLAVERVYANPDHYDAVLMDIQMPEMDGLEACRQIRAFLKADSLPIIAMTAHALDQERNRCLDAGMNDHISKPIDPDVLFRKLSRWISPAHVNVEQPLSGPSVAPQESDEGLPNVLPPFAISDALSRMNGDRRLLKSLILMFANRYADAPKELLRLREAGDYKELHRLAHTLKGVAGSLGAVDAYRAAMLLETTLQKDSSADAREITDALSKSIKIALTAAQTLQ